MPQPLSQLAIQLHPRDNVAIAKQDIPARTTIIMPDHNALKIGESIPEGHKFALCAIAAGEPVLRYGYRIGMATEPIAPGAWVHTHNLAVGDIAREYAWTVVENPLPQPARHTFLGFRRPDGRVGTRNYIAVIATSNCSAHVTTQIARAFTPERLAAYPNIDGVIPIIHHSGCCVPIGGASYVFLQRALANIARNPNIGAYVVVGLGCEGNQVDKCFDVKQLDAAFVIQEQGGFRKTVAAAVQVIEQLLPRVNACHRTPQPISELNIALECGGSDSWSGVTANPLVGLVADAVVKQGGMAVLAETPEIFGAEHLLSHRVVSAEVGRKFAERFAWWNEQARLYGFSMDNNPSPGNKAGGLTTIFEKSLGAVAKGGSTPLTAVYEYTEFVTSKGLVFMDTPGYDPTATTGQLAGGCNLLIFTTGRGSLFGSNIVPCVKVASNSALYKRMSDDMDFNAGRVLEDVPMQTAADELLHLVIAVASGQRTKTEQKGLPECEFVPWHLGAML